MDWLSCRSLADQREAPPRRGLTVLELVVVISIIAGLLAIGLPALGAARESARRMVCSNHLRQIGVALQVSHERQRRLPSGVQVDWGRQTGWGWAVPLLADLEQSNLTRQIHQGIPLQGDENTRARHVELPVLLCPSDLTQPEFPLKPELDGAEGGAPAASSDDEAFFLTLPTANYIGVFGAIDPDLTVPAPPGDGAFVAARGRRWADFQRGLSRTIIVGERTMAKLPSTWIGVDLRGEDAVSRLVGAALLAPNSWQADECDFSSRHRGGVLFLWGDGHVELVADDIDLRQYQEIARLGPAAETATP